MKFGGQYVSNELKQKLNNLKKEFNQNKNNPEFKKLLTDYIGRPTSLYYAENLTKHFNGPKIYLKREDLNHTGSHKINNAIGQILLAKKLGYTEIIAETGAGQHGVATATACALFNLKCKIFMGEVDINKQQPNVQKMKLLGAEVISVANGTLKEAVDEALDYFVKHPESYYLIGSAVGPAPYPEIVQHFQKIIGEETKRQIMKKEGRLPDAIIACVGGGSNAIGMFTPFLKTSVKLYGIEGAGLGLETGKHASAFFENNIDIMHGMKTFAMKSGEAYSISSGLDYPGVGPVHAILHHQGRVIYDTITDQEASEAFYLLTSKEGIIPALESSHAIAYLNKICKQYKKDQIIIINLSGRGDKDMDTMLNL